MSVQDNVVYFAHGKESGPWGRKIKALAKVARSHGCRVESPDYSSVKDPDERVKMLLALKPQARKNLILVGSSMGGYVAATASSRLKVQGLFLMAPAFFRRGYRQADPKPKAKHTLIVHGWHDELIPAEHSFAYVKKYGGELYVMDSDHGLASALPQIKVLFDVFLDGVLNGR